MRSLALASTLLALTACSSQGNGDLDHLDAEAKPFGTPIAQQNDPAHRLPSGATLKAPGVVVVAVDTYDETKDGKSIGNVYVEDPIQPTPWSGMTLYRVSTTPPDLALVPGQGVNLVGPYQPFAGPSSGAFPVVLPEVVQGTVSLAYEAAPPAPVDLTMNDLADATKAMQYVGMLVRLKNVTVSAAFSEPRQEAAINGSTSLVLAGQLMPLSQADGGTVTPNATFKSVTGLLNYFYTLKLCPRTSADFEK